MFVESTMSGIRGIVFDAVGTLIEPNPSVSEAYSMAARRQGIEIDPTVLKKRFHSSFAVDESDEARGPLSTDEMTERRRWRRIVSVCLPEVPDRDKAFEELWEHFASPSSWIVFPDASRMLAGLQLRGFPVCIGSNFDARLRRVISGLPNLSDLSGDLVISSEVGYRKPHRAFYEAACAHLGLAPEAVLFVGDDLENDVNGPRRAGLQSHLIVRSAMSHPAEPSSPSLANLASILDWD